MEFSTGQPLAEYNRIYKETAQLYHGLALRMGLADSELVILYTLALSGDGCLQRDIVGNACLSKQTVNSATRRMVRQGLLTLTPGKGREMQMHLTEAGRQLAARTVLPLARAERAAIDALTEEELQTYLALSRKLLEQLRRTTAGL